MKKQSSSYSSEIDDPSRISALRELLIKKPSLRAWYSEIYSKYRDCLNRTTSQGLIVELGSGASFIKDYIPEALTTDVIAYEGLDKIVDATQMPFENNSLRAVFLTNVLHHIPQAKKFFQELDRCLMEEGRVFMVDQHVGPLSSFIYKNLHHEPFEPQQKDWIFETTGPLSGANGALAWMIFFRDRSLFEKDFPRLKIEKITIHSPLRYWLLGGLKNWTLLPKFAFKGATVLDKSLVSLFPSLGSFMDIELKKESHA